MCLTLRQEGRRPRGSAGTDSVSAPAPASPARCPSLWVAHARPSPRPPPLVPGWWVRVTWVRLASSSRQGARPRAGFRFGGSEMTEPGASPDDPWVKASPAGAHAGEGRAGRARARGGAGRRGDSLQSPKVPPPFGPRGCREDSSHPARAKVGRQVTRVCTSVRGRGLGAGRCWSGVGADGILRRGGAPKAYRLLARGAVLQPPVHPRGLCVCVCVDTCGRVDARAHPAIACAPCGGGAGLGRGVCARARRERRHGLRPGSDECLLCLVTQVEYAYSDNSLDPGECLLHRLQLPDDTPATAL